MSPAENIHYEPVTVQRTGDFIRVDTKGKPVTTSNALKMAGHLIREAAAAAEGYGLPLKVEDLINYFRESGFFPISADTTLTDLIKLLEKK